MVNHKKLHSYREYTKDYIKLVYPLIASSLVYAAMPVADNLMVGKVGILSLAAASFANSIFTACSIFPRGMSYGLTTLVTIAQSKSHHKEVSSLLIHALVLNTLLGIVFCILTWLLASSLRFFGQDAAVVGLASPYLRLLALSLVPMMVFNTFFRFLEGLSDTKPCMWISVLGVLINIMLNYLLIYGTSHTPKLGLYGAGLATLLSRLCILLLTGAYLTFAPHLKEYRITSSTWQLSGSHFAKIIQLGLPLSLHLVLEMTAFALMATMAGWLGVIAQAANAIVTNIVDVILGITWAISIATSVMVSKPFGRLNAQQLKKASLISFLLGNGMALLLALLLIATYQIVFPLYNGDQAVLNLAASLVGTAALFTHADSIYSISMGALRGMKNTRSAAIVGSGSSWLIGLPISWLLSFKLHQGVVGVWWGKTIAFYVAGLVLCRLFYKKYQSLSAAKEI